MWATAEQNSVDAALERKLRPHGRGRTRHSRQRLFENGKGRVRGLYGYSQIAAQRLQDFVVPSDCWPAPRLLVAKGLEIGPQHGQMRLQLGRVALPAADGVAIDRLPHLGLAR